MKYNLVQRVFLVKKVYELKEISLVQRAFRREYPKDGTPNYSVIKNQEFPPIEFLGHTTLKIP